MPIRDQNPGGTRWLAQTNREDYEGVSHVRRGFIGSEIITKSSGKREEIHDPYRSRLEIRRYRHHPVNPHKNDPVIPNTPQNELEKRYGKPFLTDAEWEKSEERQRYCRRTFNKEKHD